jgi:hypothetical protein
MEMMDHLMAEKLSKIIKTEKIGQVTPKKSSLLRLQRNNNISCHKGFGTFE